MIANPQRGQTVQVWYRKELREYMPYHGKLGTVVTPSKGRPRNHGVMIGGELVCVPCGNLRKV